MPYCEPCERFFSPNTLHEDGSCPVCAEVIAEPPKRATVPWHFWLMLGAGGIYLLWRLIDGILWLVT